MKKNMQWNDENCSNQYYFICAYYSDGYRPELESKKLQNAKMTREIRTYFKTWGIKYFWASKEITQNMATFIL